MANNRKSTKGRINQYVQNTELINAGTPGHPRFVQVPTGTTRMIRHVAHR